MYISLCRTKSEIIKMKQDFRCELTNGPESSRIILITSEAHWIKNPLRKLSEHNHNYNHLNFSFFY